MRFKFSLRRIHLILGLLIFAGAIFVAVESSMNDETQEIRY